jgi:hypothetical protein
MWTCAGCQEKSDDDFDVCWNCGTGRDGTPDPTFRRADAPDLPRRSRPHNVATAAQNRPFWLVQVLWSTAGAVLGASLGVLCWIGFEYEAFWAAFVGGLGAFVGLALTLPGVSIWRVLGGTAGMIAAENLSEGTGDSLYRWIAGEGDEIDGGSPTLGPNDAAKPGDA